MQKKSGAAKAKKEESPPTAYIVNKSINKTHQHGAESPKTVDMRGAEV